MSFRKIGAAAARHFNKVEDAVGHERAAHRVLLEQVAANQADVGLADFDKRLAGRVVRRSGNVKAAIGSALSQQWNVQHGHLV